VRLTCVDGLSRSGATALRTPGLFRCVAAPLRETFFGALRFSSAGGAGFGIVRGAVADIRLLDRIYMIFKIVM